MNVLSNSLYCHDIEWITETELPWEKLENKTVLITGATGMIASCFVDALMTLNKNRGLNCKVIAMGRNAEKARIRFGDYWNDECFEFLEHDINKPLEVKREVNYILHMASNTHPLAYATDPVGTITTNIMGLYNLLEFGRENLKGRFAFASSNEIYGENRGDVELFDEKYLGYIDCNTMRAGYPESKRCGEALCQAYIKQYGMDIVIPRFTRTYGPTMLQSDTKAISQFIKKGINKEDIVLKSLGNQNYSYTYVADAVSGLFHVLLKGEKGEAYNIADESGNITLKDLAETISEWSGTKVVFELPDDVEKSGYSTATKALLDGSKIKELGWKPRYDIRSGIRRNLDILSAQVEK